MGKMVWSAPARLAGLVVLASTIGLAPRPGYAVPSISVTPTEDVYAILAQNPGLAASIPLYTAPQVTGHYTSLTVIGDSYGDWGNALQFNPVSSQVGADGRYGNGLNIIDALQYHYDLPDSAVTNYAFGGATTGSVNNNPPALQLPGFAQQIQTLVNSGRHFGPSDLVTITTAGVGGGNDTPEGISIAQGTANIVSYINTLVGLGARNILLDSQALSGTVALQAALAPFVSQGVDITLFDGATLVNSILADPTAYGFAANATATDYCTQFGGPNVCNGGGANKVELQTTAQILTEDNYLFFYAHPTTALAALIGEDEANLLDNSIQTVPEPSSLGVLAGAVLGLIVIAALSRRQPQRVFSYTPIAPTYAFGAGQTSMISSD